jgi:hypothetical protein
LVKGNTPTRLIAMKLGRTERVRAKQGCARPAEPIAGDADRTVVRIVKPPEHPATSDVLRRFARGHEVASADLPELGDSLRQTSGV